MSAQIRPGVLCQVLTFEADRFHRAGRIVRVLSEAPKRSYDRRSMHWWTVEDIHTGIVYRIPEKALRCV